MVSRRSVQLVGLAAIVAFVVLPAILTAQKPRRLKRCLPYPMLSDELCELAYQNCAESEAPRPRVFIDSLSVLGASSLSPALRQRMLSALKSGESSPGPFNENWLNGLEEVAGRGTLQEDGYLTANVSAEGHILQGDESSQHVAITLHVEEGTRYRLRSVEFRTAAGSPPPLFGVWTLRQRVPLKDGAIFDVSKIRQGLSSLTRLYGARGYIDLTIEPDFEIDEKSATIALTLVLDPQKPYRVGKVQILGPDADRENLLRSKWKVGEIFDSRQLDAFLKENKALLPEDVSRDDVQVVRNGGEGTVDLRFDFRVCPPPQI